MANKDKSNLLYNREEIPEHEIKKQTFKEAFRAARANDPTKDFMFEGKKYSTKLAEKTPAVKNITPAAKKVAPVDEEQVKFDAFNAKREKDKELKFGDEDYGRGVMRKGGVVKMAKGGFVRSADGAAKRGKTKGRTI